MSMRFILTMAIMMLSSQNSFANVINFDDLPPNLDPVPSGYQGFEWNNSNATGVLDVTPYLSSGVDYTGIENNILFNAYGYLGNNSTIITDSNSGVFDFLSGYWTEGIAGDVQISFQGLLNSQVIYSSSTYDINLTSVTFIELNWLGIDELRINSSAGVWVADNINLNSNTSAVPLPAGVWLLSTSLLGIIGLRRRASSS